MNQTPQQRGSSFESLVESALAELRSKHPTLVDFDHPFTLTLRTGRVVKPDFRLEVRWLYQTDVRLIECQSRNESDHSLVDKIGSIRRDSDHNRFVFVYENPPSEAVRKEFEQHGVVLYHIDEFRAFITKLDESLRAQSTPVSPLAAPPPPTSPSHAQPAFHPRVEKGLGGSPSITTKAGFGSIRHK